MKVRLETGKGDLVADSDDGGPTMLPYPEGKEPKTVVWGDRFFALHGRQLYDDGDVVVYREVFGVVIGAEVPAQVDPVEPRLS